MNKIKKTALLIYTTIILIGIVSSVSPFKGTSPEGFEIKYPNFDVLKQGQDFLFEFQVYNTSNGVPITSGISCDFHLYNISGNHIAVLHDSTPSNIYDYEFIVNGANFSNTGSYSYVAQCNNSAQGGFVDAPFKVTPLGFDTNTGESLLYFLFVFIILGGIILLFYFITILPSENERNDEGTIIGIVKLKYIRILLIALMYPLVIIILNLMNGLAVNFVSLSIFAGTLGLLVEIMVRVAWVFTLVIIVWIFYLLVKDSNAKQHFKNMENMI